MRIFSFFTVLLLIISVFSCNNDKTPMQQIYGKWKGLKWEVDGEPITAMDWSIIRFEFKRDSIYHASFGTQNEKGTFNLNNNCFNAHSIYNVRKKCPIIKFSKDTMIWLMDSVEQRGHLYLVREK